MSNRHICFVDSIRTWGGAEVWMLETARQLLAQGYRCSIVAQPDSELFRRAQKTGVPCVGIPIRFDAAPWTLARLAWYFRRKKVTAIVTNLTKDLKAAAVAGKMAGVRIILASRESDFPLKNKLYYRWYFNGMATGVLVNSRATRKTVLDSAPWLDKDRLHLLYKGIDTEQFCLAPEALEGPPTIGCAGQLIERKGLLDLMTAWEIVENRQWNMRPHLTLAGEGPLAQTMENWKRTLQFPENVTLPGYHENIAQFYHQLTLLVMPSLSEGFGLAAAEAASCGVPVIATDTSSLPEIVLHEKTGLLVPVHQPEQLAEAMIQLLDNKNSAKQFGTSGRKHVMENFSLQKTLDKLLRLTERPS